MSFTIEQKVNGHIYLYEVTSYWDKVKKQPRQRRVYKGPKHKIYKQKVIENASDIIVKNFGNIYLLDYLSRSLGLTELLRTVFPQSYKEILALSYYDITEGSPYYLFNYFQSESYFPGLSLMSSQETSKLCELIGKSQRQRMEFIKRWISHLQPLKGLYYDITSVSSYSTQIEFIEWGYNRDNENLSQQNIGLICCKETSQPLFYNITSGSIVDVSTLKNCLSYLKIFKISDVEFILDKGFFSKSNVLEMNSKDACIKFIMPLPNRLKKVKQLLAKHGDKLSDPSNAFEYNEEILYHISETITFDKDQFDVHIYMNEKLGIEQKHNFLKDIIKIENSFKTKEYKTRKEYLEYVENEIPKKYIEYFRWNKQTLKIEQHVENIELYLKKVGSFLLLTNQKKIDMSRILKYYRNKDAIEKLFNIVKNEMDGRRIRSHSTINSDGRLFVKFIALIIYTKLLTVMRQKKLIKKYTVKELLYELKKLKLTTIEKEKPILGVISKKQRLIFEAFDIKPDDLHSY